MRWAGSAKGLPIVVHRTTYRCASINITADLKPKGKRTMKQVLLYVPAVLLLAFVAARAQGTVEVRDDVVFSTNDATEKQQKLSFGFGTEYTDSTDFNKGEMILPPFFPTDGFLVCFGVKEQFGSEDLGTIEMRGVPDWV